MPGQRASSTGGRPVNRYAPRGPLEGQSGLNCSGRHQTSIRPRAVAHPRYLDRITIAQKLPVPAPAPTNDGHAPQRSVTTNGTITAPEPCVWRFVLKLTVVM